MNLTESGAMILALAGSLIFALILIFIWLVIQIAARWKIFTKAGEAGWKSLIPFYSTYTQYRITWQNGFIFWIWLALYVINGLNQLSSELTAEEFQFVRDAYPSIVNFAQAMEGRLAAVGVIAGLCSYVLSAMSMYKLARAFGRGTLFALGLFFLNPIFMPILGFGRSEYQGPQ